MPTTATFFEPTRRILFLTRRLLSDLTLSSQFAIVGGLLMTVSAVIASHFVSDIVTKTAIDRTATSTALLVESLISTNLQGLRDADILSSDNTGQIDEIVSAPTFRTRFPHLDIWKANGAIAYSTSPEITGRRFAPPPGLTAALDGVVTAGFTDLSADEHVSRGFRTRFLEVYFPIRDDKSGDIIAVAEIHEISQPLRDKVAKIETAVWMGVGGATALIMLGLFSIVYRGTRLIDAQQTELRRRIGHIARISEQNRELRERVQGAASRLSEITEGTLRRLGADLHDGPAQLIGFALIRLDHLQLAPSAEKREQELNDLGGVLREALDNIRALSRDLLLPELKSLSMNEVISRVVRIHERRTQSAVSLDCKPITGGFSYAAKICTYRFIQEGLYNAFRHAKGRTPTVTCEWNDGTLTVAVQDFGDRAMEDLNPVKIGLGLIGLRERVESLGGVFTISGDEGFRIEMSISETASV